MGIFSRQKRVLIRVRHTRLRSAPFPLEVPSREDWETDEGSKVTGTDTTTTTGSSPTTGRQGSPPGTKTDDYSNGTSVSEDSSFYGGVTGVSKSVWIHPRDYLDVGVSEYNSEGTIGERVSLTWI